jgi:hypothetical protein
MDDGRFHGFACPKYTPYPLFGRTRQIIAPDFSLSLATILKPFDSGV